MKISTCLDRTNLRYQEENIDWADFIERIRVPVTTKETQAQYLRMDKKMQSTIKDVGGFVGGRLLDGKRKNGHLKDRCMITLDLDFAPDDFQAETEGFPFRYAVYSTHKHKRGSAKYRLIIPLKHEISDGDEYTAVARKVADYFFKMDWFDDTTYQPVRMMFWPSVSKDGAYEMWHEDDRPLLDSDDILGLYDTDWRDASCWPCSSRELEVKIPGKKAEDPLTKRGMIGSFCRAYTITQAIDEFLQDVYISTDKPDRYTYAEGSAYGGLVCYEDKWAYSNHATDPAGGGHLQNAYDLVRIHKFKSDSQAKSEERMNEWCIGLDGVKEELARERLNDLKDFDDDDFVEDNVEWVSQLELNAKTQKPVATINNLMLILSNDTRLKDGIGGLNEFVQRHEKKGSLPWWTYNKANPYWTDADDSGLRAYIENGYEIYNISKLTDALNVLVQRESFHPLRAYLDGLEWDGIKRADTLLIDYMGADDDLYTRTVTRKHLCACVGRIYQPGVKYDYVLDLVGDQGIGKSQLISRLAVKQQYFSDSISSFDRKKLVESMQGKWLLEIGEMAAAKKSDEADLKAAISATDDTVRLSYARHPQTFLRQSVFWGTTNEGIHLKDQTGNRRFWPVECHPSRRQMTPFDLTPEIVDQIWAESVLNWKAGEPLHLDPDLEAVAREKQEAHTYISEEEGLIMDWLDRKLPDHYYKLDPFERADILESEDDESWTMKREHVCCTEVWTECLHRRKEDLKRAEQIRVGEMLRRFGWEQRDRSRDDPFYGLQRYYWRKR